MLRPALLIAVLVAGCSKGPDADLPYIGQARSLAAEWALVNEQASSRKLTATYVVSMRQSIRDQLETTHQSLTRPDSHYGEEIAALLEQPDDAAPQDLRSRADRLKQIENGLESA